MKKLIVIFTLAIYFFSTTELIQLLKLPVLISHFIDHKAEDDMSFIDYMVHHYGGHEKDADWETDMKLPFMQQSDLLLLMVTPPKILANLADTAPCWIIIEKTFFYQDDNIPNSYLSSIWQPPKFS